jgi:hypothetical protein
MLARLVALFVCSAPLVAGAADWLPVFRAPSGIEYSIDKSALVVISGDDRMIEAWDKERLPYPRGWMQLEGERIDLINNARRWVVHDCERHEIEIVRFEVYFNDWWVDEVSDAQFSLFAPPYVWRWLATPRHVLPGSGGEAIHKAVCKLGAKQRM